MVRKIVIPATFALISMVGACTSWQPISVGPSQYIQEARPKSIRVTKSDGSRSVIELPELRNDSILGDWNLTGQACGFDPVSGEAACVADREPTTSIPVADIAGAEGRRMSVVRTTLAVIGAAAVSVALYGIFTSFQREPETVWKCGDGGKLGWVCGSYAK